MIVNYTVLDPAKNITIIVHTSINKKDRRMVADKLMQKEPSAEQVGFLEGNVLDMAGGEFCGNAVRCAATVSGESKIICAGQEINCDDTAAYIPKDLAGINHYIFTSTMPKEDAERQIKEKACGSATGFMFLDQENMKLVPLVYVPEADTLYWENSCASGSVAVGKYLCETLKTEIDVKLQQPGGALRVKTSPEDQFVMIDGKIDIVNRGELCIPELNY